MKTKTIKSGDDTNWEGNGHDSYVVLGTRTSPRGGIMISVVDGKDSCCVRLTEAETDELIAALQELCVKASATP